MSFGDQVTAKLNSIEGFIENSSIFLFPLKMLGWIVLLLALIITNFMAVVKWPISAIYKKINRKELALESPINITSDEELKKIVLDQGTVLVDFWAEWCGPCLLMESAINNIAQEYAGKVTVVKVDVSLKSTLSKLYAVRGLPTIIVFRDGDEVIRRSGSLTKNQLAELIEQ